ncbi:MAG: hypothetical protein U5L09_12595 [Bacteroidales bacterium]|nr:hypothetical protein [Bacteroidales bacterium]
MDIYTGLVLTDHTMILISSPQVILVEVSTPETKVIGDISDGDPVWSETSDYNKLYLKQDGKQNFATGAVAGDYNDIDIRQTGEGNMVGSAWSAKDGVVITGDRNEVDVRQTGIAGHSATVNQTGNWNTSTTIQTP